MSSTIKLENPPIDTEISISLVEHAILSRTSESKSTIKNWKASRIGQNRGFVADMVRLVIEWMPEKENHRLPKSVVLKLPTVKKIENLREDVGEKSQTDEIEWDAGKLVRLAQIAECAFYNYSMSQTWTVKHPTCYLAKVSDPALLIFADLSDCHYFDFADGVTLKQALQTADTLATLHAHCIKNPGFQSYPNLHSAAAEMLDCAAKTLPPVYKLLSQSAKKDYPDLFDPIADRLPDIVQSEADLDFMKSLNQEFGLPPVIVHGDLHVQNMAFDKEDPDTLTALFDWQGCHIGSVVEDFGRLLCFSADAELRRNHLTTILSHYYTSLAMQLQPGKVPFAYETLRKAFDKALHYAAAFCLSSLLMIPKHDWLFTADVENKRKKILTRAKCLLEDCLELIEGKN